jgi:hypothetical protein
MPVLLGSTSEVVITPKVVETVINVPSRTIFPKLSLIGALDTVEVEIPSATIEVGLATKLIVPDGFPGLTKMLPLVPISVPLCRVTV